jgi:hypothetical protein
MITPAILILASASLIATALVRLTRIVDRIRKLAEVRDGSSLDRSKELDRHERRRPWTRRAIRGALQCEAIAACEA